MIDDVKSYKKLKGITFCRSNIYIKYSFLFIIVSLITFLPFYIEAKSFIWNTDGINQHYPILYYYGSLLRGLLSGQGFPMVDFKLGIGFDTITTLHYYALGDPIALLSVFMSQENSVFIYGMLVIGRLYLAGISFILLAKTWGKSDLAIILGALIYVFCGYSFYAGVRHPFFLNPIIYLPLLLLGLEKILQKKKPILFIMTTFLTAISNFYFFYMLTIIAVFYFIIRYIYLNKYLKERLFKEFILSGLKTGGYYLLGLGMAAFIFLPVVYAFLQISRLESNPQMLIGYLHYQKDYYIKMLQGTIGTGVYPGYWTNLVFSTVICVNLAIVMSYKKYRYLRILILSTFMALSIPAFGYIMNGFSYISNRWSFSVSLLAAIVFIATYEDLFVRSKKLNLILLLGTVGYGILAFFYRSTRMVKYEFFILVFVIIIILSLQAEPFKGRQQIQNFIVSVLLVLTLAFHGYAYYSSDFNGYVNEFLSKDEVINNTFAGMGELIQNIDDDMSFYRIETYGDLVRNEALCVDFNDVSAYFSIMDGHVTDYYKQLELLNQRNTYRFDNHDSRTILNALANVKYFATTKKSAAPYAYKLIGEKEGIKKYYLYENLFWIPLGYTYDHYILEEEYAGLNALEKQNVMLNAVVLESPPEGLSKTDKDPGEGIEKLKVNIIPDDNIEMSDNLIKVKKAGAVITLEIESKPKSELYVRLKDFDIKKRAAAMDTLVVKANKEASKKVNVRSPYHNTYFRNDYLINTGYSRDSKSLITIKFLQKGSYSYDSIDVYNLDMNYYKSRIKELGQDTLNNIYRENNLIQGDIILDKDKIMVFSIPYSKGWSVYVNNEKTEVLRANTMHTAVLLKEGTNHITLKYRTPFLLPGIIISVASTMIFILLLFSYKKRERGRDNGSSISNSPML